MLGYFSIIGLLRVHVLLGDFTLALKVMENVELNQKVGATRMPCACNSMSRVYLSFCYRRTIVTILNRMRPVRPNVRDVQGAVTKQIREIVGV